jgi:hypothetical protein
MIYVHRDWLSIPEEIKNALIAAADALDKIADPAERKKFIEDNQGKWSAVREFLVNMSHRKCWYSEASERVSRYQVDHFRPHGRAKQAERDTTEGYSWLAFELENFRLAGQLCNTANQEYSDETVGKAIWFPLVDPSQRATLLARDCSGETPILLDPTDPDDPPKLVFNDDGGVEPSAGLDPAQQANVQLAINYLGLSQSQLNEARRKVWRECSRAVEQYSRFARKGKGNRSLEEETTMKESFGRMIALTKSTSEFSAVSRCCLYANGMHGVIQRDELAPLGNGYD